MKLIPPKHFYKENEMNDNWKKSIHKRIVAKVLNIFWEYYFFLFKYKSNKNIAIYKRPMTSILMLFNQS